MEERQWISREEEPSYSGTDLCLLILFLKEEEEKYEKAEKRQGTVTAGITSCLRRAQATWTFQKSLRGEGATCIFTEEPAKDPGQRHRSQAPTLGWAGPVAEQLKGRTPAHGAGRSHGAQPAALAAAPGGTLPATAALPAPHTTQGAQSSHRLHGWAIAQGHLQGFLGVCFWYFKIYVKRKCSFCIFVSTWLSFLYVKSQWKLLHRNNAI